MHRARDRHGLPFAAGQRGDRGRGRNRLADPDPPQKIAGCVLHRAHVHALENARPLDRLAAEEQIARDRQLHDQRGILVDRLDAQRDRVRRAAYSDLLAAHIDRAAGRRHGARKHLDQRRLARAVVAEQPDDFAAIYRQVDVLERLDAAIELVDAFHADEFFGHRLQVPARWRRSSQECSAIMPRMIAPMKML